MSGTEILGLVASVVQIADLGVRLSMKLYRFGHKFKNANHSIQSLSKEIAITSNVLYDLRKSLEQDDQVHLYSPNAFVSTQAVLEECKKIFEQINGVVEQPSPEKSTARARFQRVTQSFGYLLNESHLAALGANLERLKSTMSLILASISLAKDIRSRQEGTVLQEERDLIEWLAEEKSANERKFHQLTKAVESVALNGGQTGFGLLAVEHSKDELDQYHHLVQKILHDIDSMQDVLGRSRHARIRNGVLQVHEKEVPILRQTYGNRVVPLFTGPLFECIPGQMCLDSAKPDIESDSNIRLPDVYDPEKDCASPPLKPQEIKYQPQSNLPSFGMNEISCSKEPSQSPQQKDQQQVCQRAADALALLIGKESKDDMKGKTHHLPIPSTGSHPVHELPPILPPPPPYKPSQKPLPSIKFALGEFSGIPAKVTHGIHTYRLSDYDASQFQTQTLPKEHHPDKAEDDPKLKRVLGEQVQDDDGRKKHWIDKIDLDTTDAGSLVTLEPSERKRQDQTKSLSIASPETWEKWILQWTTLGMDDIR